MFCNNVVLPDCLGPVIVITEKYFAASFITVANSLSINSVFIIYANLKYHCKYT